MTAIYEVADHLCKERLESTSGIARSLILVIFYVCKKLREQCAIKHVADKRLFKCELRENDKA
jgi:hypothetical protein